MRAGNVEPFQRRVALRKSVPVDKPAVSDRFWRGLVVCLVITIAIGMAIIGLWLMLNTLTSYEALGASAPTRTQTQTPAPTIHLTMTPTRTPRPTRTATPRPTLAPVLVHSGAGWVGWWGDEHDLADRRVYIRRGELAPGSPVWVCTAGEVDTSTFSDRRNISDDAGRPLRRCTDGYIAAGYDDPMPGGILIGAIGAGVREDLIGSVSEVWPLTNVAIFLFNVPPGYQVVERGRG